MYTTWLYHNWVKYEWWKVTPPQTVRTFEYTWTQEHLTLDWTKMWKIECWWAGSNTAAGWYASWILTTDLNKVNITIIAGKVEALLVEPHSDSDEVQTIEVIERDDDLVEYSFKRKQLLHQMLMPHW